ncbi:MAG: exopolyphosphatase [Hirschia sp.]|nr:exopolyphosphatase [Hirschia sp.]
MAGDGSTPSTARRVRKGGQRAPTFAALDLGTNNCRLLIAERAGDSFRVVDSYSRIVRLGEGLNATGKLSDAAMNRAFEALSVCSDRIKKNKVSKVRCIGTQACRVAENGGQFAKAVKAKTGLSLEIISPKEEAKLALIGSWDLIDTSRDFTLVVDIGGGSTELSWVDANAARSRGVAGCMKRPTILGWGSFPIGVVTLSEAFPEDGADWYEQLVQYVVDLLSEHDSATRFGALFQKGRGQLLGTSGTVTSLAAVHLGLDRYVRSAVDGTWVSFEEMVAAREKLRLATPDERAQIPCIGADRADLVLAGCAILDAIWRLWPSERLRAADRGLREGVLLGLMQDSGGSKRRRRSKRKKSPAKTGVGQSESSETHDG